MIKTSYQQLCERSAQYGNGLGTPLTDEELLTLVLCPAGKPSRRMQRIARRLLHTLGLQGFAQELANMPAGLHRFGLSLQEINRLAMAHELLMRCQKTTMQLTKTVIRSTHDAAARFRREMAHLDHEEMHLMVLDTMHQVREYRCIYKGTVNATSVRAIELFRPAIVRNCPAIVVAHNHPSGQSFPSAADIAITRILLEASRALDIELVDHLILGHNPTFTSLKEIMSW